MEGENPFIFAAKSLWDLVVEMMGALLTVLPKIISFILWVLVALIVLPSVFIAGNVYEKWVEWGESF